LAVGRLAIRRLAVFRSSFKSLELSELSIGRLRVKDLDVTNTLTLPDGGTVSLQTRGRDQAALG
jgi:hypothetical protein